MKRNVLQVSQPPVGTSSSGFPKRGVRVRVRAVALYFTLSATVANRFIALNFTPTGAAVTMQFFAPRVYVASELVVVQWGQNLSLAGLTNGTSAWATIPLPDGGIILEPGDDLAIYTDFQGNDQLGPVLWVFDDMPDKTGHGGPARDA